MDYLFNIWTKQYIFNIPFPNILWMVTTSDNFILKSKTIYFGKHSDIHLTTNDSQCPRRQQIQKNRFILYFIAYSTQYIRIALRRTWYFCWEISKYACSVRTSTVRVYQVEYANSNEYFLREQKKKKNYICFFNILFCTFIWMYFKRFVTKGLICHERFERRRNAEQIRPIIYLKDWYVFMWPPLFK